MDLILQAFHINIFPRTKSKNNPPGPKPLPIIGNLLNLGNKPHKSLAKLSQSYGPVMCLKFGRITSIVISSSALAKQVLQTHDQFFSHRTIPDAVRAHDHDRFGMAWIPVSTPRWRKLRRLCSHHLFSARSLEANQILRQNKVRKLLSDVEKVSKPARQWILVERLLGLPSICCPPLFSPSISPVRAALTSRGRSRRLCGGSCKRRGSPTWPTISRCLSGLTHKALGGEPMCKPKNSLTCLIVSSTRGCV